MTTKELKKFSTSITNVIQGIKLEKIHVVRPKEPGDCGDSNSWHEVYISFDLYNNVDTDGDFKTAFPCDLNISTKKFHFLSENIIELFNLRMSVHQTNYCILNNKLCLNLTVD